MDLDSARLFRLALAVSLAVSALSFFLFTWRWPLVGDASLIHYIAFLISRGWAPYRQLGDMNMPGSYLIELAAMRVFGMGALAWRLFDFTLLGIAAAAFLLICRNQAQSATDSPRVRSNWFAALFASSLFILIHGRDGLSEGGQRDLTMAVCLLAATAFLFLTMRCAQNAAPTTHSRAGRSRSDLRLFLDAALFGLLSGVAATIKPTAILLTIAQLLLALYALRPDRAQQTEAQSDHARRMRLAASALFAYLIAPLLALLFLLREHALPDFLAGFHRIVPYYASLGHRPLGFVLLHSLSPLLALILLWLLVLLLGAFTLRPNISFANSSRNFERTALLAGILFGLLNCVAQQRALPYYRYPLLVFLLPLIALDLTAILDLPTTLQSSSAPPRSKRIASTMAALALAYGALFLAPQSAVLIHRYRWWETDFISSLQSNLNALGGPSLSGRIQCIDSISGCNNVLYRMRLEPSTGVLSDFLLFGSLTDRQPAATIPILRDTRAAFLATLTAHPPQVIVVTSHLHIDGPDNFEKLARWPAFADLLTTRYVLATQWSPARTARWWSREETPASYRIYVLRDSPLRDLSHPAIRDPAFPHP